MVSMSESSIYGMPCMVCSVYGTSMLVSLKPLTSEVNHISPGQFTSTSLPRTDHHSRTNEQIVSSHITTNVYNCMSTSIYVLPARVHNANNLIWLDINRHGDDILYVHFKRWMSADSIELKQNHNHWQQLRPSLTGYGAWKTLLIQN